MKKFVYIIIFLMSFQLSWSQTGTPISVFVTVKRSNPNKQDDAPKTVPVGKGYKVYAFKNLVDAEAFIEDIRYKHQRSLKDPLFQIDNFLPYESVDSTNRNGECELIARSNGYIAVFKTPENIISKKSVYINNQREVEVYVSGLDSMIHDVPVIGHFPLVEPENHSYDCGDQRTIDIYWPVLEKETNTTYRIGMAPYCMEVSGEDYGFTSEYQKIDSKTGKLFKKLIPTIIDGAQFDNTQVRKMGYDPIKNDSLYRYVNIKGMLSNQAVIFDKEKNEYQPLRFHIVGQLKNIKSDAFYPVWAYKWCENYGSLLASDTLPIDLGYRTDRTKFLEFNFPEININENFYSRPPRADLDEDRAYLDIKFVNGKSEILPTDSIGLQKLDEIIQKLEEIKNDNNAKLYTVSVHGFASPEGGRSINEKLCRSRAAYLRQQIINRLGAEGIDFKIDGEVATWQDVATYLREDSLSDPDNINRAIQIEEIIASTKDETGIEARLRGLPIYKFLKENEEKYYKPLRKVIISYQYSQRVILTKDQVIKRYERTKSATFPYQYQYLFKYLENRPEELGKIAEKAMKEVIETTGKPWTLAAYYLAKSYTARNMCDTTLLSPYITITGKECYISYPGSRLKRTRSTLLNSIHFSMDGDTIQIMNDEGIIVQQISMLIQADKISQALNLARHLLPPNDTVYQKPIMMLECKCEKKYNDKMYRDIIAATSDWNKVVIFAAQDAASDNINKAAWEDAWNTLNDTTNFRFETARELYMKATLAYRLYETAHNWNKRTDKTPVPEIFFDFGEYTKFDAPDFDNEFYPWGACMIKACEIEPSFLNILKFDGEFNQNYRDGFAKYWNKKHPDNILR